ncbi:hypothetical protein ABK040_006235 [Willaertia magna]
MLSKNLLYAIKELATPMAKTLTHTKLAQLDASNSFPFVFLSANGKSKLVQRSLLVLSTDGGKSYYGICVSERKYKLDYLTFGSSETEYKIKLDDVIYEETKNSIILFDMTRQVYKAKQQANTDFDIYTAKLLPKSYKATTEPEYYTHSTQGFIHHIRLKKNRDDHKSFSIHFKGGSAYVGHCSKNDILLDKGSFRVIESQIDPEQKLFGVTTLITSVGKEGKRQVNLGDYFEARITSGEIPHYFNQCIGPVKVAAEMEYLIDKEREMMY